MSVLEMRESASSADFTRVVMTLSSTVFPAVTLPTFTAMLFSTLFAPVTVDLRNMRARANAWATGDVDVLKRVPDADQRAASGNALKTAAS